MSVKVDEVFQLAIDDPFDGSVSIFELDSEDCVSIVERVNRIGDSKFCEGCVRSEQALDAPSKELRLTEVVHEDRNTMVASFIAIHDGHLDENERENTSREFLKSAGKISI